MLRLFTKAHVWSTSDDGATAVEYGIMVALIAAVIIGIVATLGGQLLTAFTSASAGW